ncbi:bifunctional SSRP1 domain/Domain of unknown function DUF1747/Structure-specific recognition protein/SSRP1 domain superfamily/PH-like domain superfamily/FACT complex subunit POB3-like [Babesia duncani]|uniref:FACT complex subunit SSRP1 n=1 Tax=Babesia duncani TaxID=323732 RepID=A0AAD9PL99_9APIC|nr:bifunctional SSRP1 domain/Domain of unknown function DUF1747/Structure-specific recognition protein/SSRP1 domain superfamily/PH-like domain superfamily/FACT complex subunit POB3-like [Babesia duncani]
MSNELFGWKNKRTGEVVQHHFKDIRNVDIITTSGGLYQLRFELNLAKQNIILRFSGFTERAVADLKAHLVKNANIEPQLDEVASTGWHWGIYDFDSSTFKLRIDNKCGIEIDPKSISQVNVPTKADLAVELRPSGHTSGHFDELVEIRFCTPSKQDIEDTEGQLEDIKQSFLLKAGLDETKSDTITLITDVPLIVPRGRYEIEFTKRGIKLHGKSYDYTMLFGNISRMFLVPKPNSPHVMFIIGLEQAMRQGQTRYPYLVLQFEVEEEIELDLNLEPAEAAELKLETQVSGKTYNIVTRLFGCLSKKSIIVPGEFKSTRGESGIASTFKATSGHLFPLNNSLLFIVKPVIFIRFDDIVSIEFSRTGYITQNRLFSFVVALRGGQEYEFTNIDRSEFEPLSNYLVSKGVRVKNAEQEQPPQPLVMDEDEEDDEEDEDFNDEEEEEDDDDDEVYTLNTIIMAERINDESIVRSSSHLALSSKRYLYENELYSLGAPLLKDILRMPL